MSRHLGGLFRRRVLSPPMAVAANRSLRALVGRNFRLYFTGQIVSTIGTWMQLLAQSWLVLQLTHSGVALGVNVTLQTLPLLVFGVWAGGIADRVDNRKLLIVTAVLGMGQALGLGVLVATGSVTTAWVYAFSFLFGLVFAFDRPAANALLFELVGPADLPSAVGLNSVIQSAGRLVGPAIGGVVIATAGISAVLLRQCRVVPRGRSAHSALLRRREMFARIRHADRRGHLRAGLRYVRERQDLRVALIVMAFVGIFVYNFMVLVPSMVKFEYHAGPGALGAVQAISGVGSVIGGLVIASVGRPTLRLLGFATSCVRAPDRGLGRDAGAHRLRDHLAPARCRRRRCSARSIRWSSSTAPIPSTRAG